MISYFYNFYQLFILILTLRKKLAYQNEYANQLLSEVIHNFKRMNDGSLDDQDYHKLNLYAVSIPAMLGESYCSLRGKPMSDEERKTMTYLAAMTGLFDDLFDKKKLPDQHILNLINEPTITSDTSSNEQLLIILYTQALHGSVHVTQIKSNCLAVFEAQKASKQQENKNISKNTIRKITQQKGGNSMLVYSNALEENLSDEEKHLIFNLGAIGQLENDIFDVYKDFQDGIHTLASSANTIKKLRKEYLEWMKKVSKAIAETKFHEKNKITFKRIAFLVICRGLVCLDQWEKLEKKTGEFNISSYSKNDLTCDMEHPINLFKLVHYTAKFLHY